MSNDTFFKYPELVTLDRRPEILGVRQAIATEKLHGSNFRVRFPAGMRGVEDIRFGSRNESFEPGDNSFYGGKPMRWFDERREMVERAMATFEAYGFSDVIVYGEVCGTSVQKGVKYAPDGDVIFRAFDIRVGENFVTYDLFVELCDKIGLTRVPEIWRGEPSKDAFDALLEQPSTEAMKNGMTNDGHVSEGVVIRSNPLLRDVFGDWLIIKHKSQKYREATPRTERKTLHASGASARGRPPLRPRRTVRRSCEVPWAYPLATGISAGPEQASCGHPRGLDQPRASRRGGVRLPHEVGP